MTTTTNLGMTLVDSAQAQKEVTINQAFTVLDAMIGLAVVDKDLATPPGSPASGALYIVAASPTGAWAGKATQLTYFDQIWRFIVPQTGMRVWVKDEATYYQFTGTSWLARSGTVDIAAGATTATVSHALVSSTSIVLAVVRANDTTALLKNVVPASGSFTVRLNAAATAITSVGYAIIQ